MAKQQFVITRDFISGVKQYAINPRGKPASESQPTDEFALEGVEFTETFHHEDLKGYGNFGCGLVGLGYETDKKLSDFPEDQHVGIHWDRVGFKRNGGGEDDWVNNAKFLCATPNGLIAVLNEEMSGKRP